VEQELPTHSEHLHEFILGFLLGSFNTNYLFLTVTSKVSCIRRKRGQIICLQGNNKSTVIFFSKGEKWYDKLLNVKYLPLFHHFKAIYQFQKHIVTDLTSAGKNE
jgi:hypothetical protein